jgi:hypothetical protein
LTKFIRFFFEPKSSLPISSTKAIRRCLFWLRREMAFFNGAIVVILIAYCSSKG